jgi:hypothetical protein
MYLSKRTYVKNWNHMPAEERHTITVTGPSANRIKPERIAYIEEQVAYWRKANAIHQWFVTHCQDGVDDCRDASVSHEQLTELRDLCVSLWETYKTDPAAAIERAMRELPPLAGFFFGSTEIDVYYWNDIEDTIALLNIALAEESDWGEFQYRSSW